MSPCREEDEYSSEEEGFDTIKRFSKPPFKETPPDEKYSSLKKNSNDTSMDLSLQKVDGDNARRYATFPLAAQLTCTLQPKDARNLQN